MTALASTLVAALRAAPADRDRLVDLAVAAIGGATTSEIPDEDAARRALWLNVYNVLTLHSVRGRRASVIAAWHRTAFVSYRIAGRACTLDDVEHGLLRANARPPYRLARSFGARDPRRDWMVPLDPRVHFALNCGAISCPPVRTYDRDGLDGQLVIAERAFLTSETAIDVGARVVTTSRILDFYADDFGGAAAILGRIERATERVAGALAGFRLRFRPYDWAATIRFADG